MEGDKRTNQRKGEVFCSPKAMAAAASVAELMLPTMVRVFLVKLVFAFPRVLWASTCIPTDFKDRYTASFELFNLAVHNLYGFFNEVEIVRRLDFLQRMTSVSSDKHLL
ncbi:hypothetical protein Tco_0989305 [Tanacetum coccineum]|uniref:Uncharacterized protein n=1 Tax=Tanacetum coccineum TaxID=301880 RepID=A0ABQ5ETB7_9ASTR